jgi:ribosomal-protein-alanine N-acetyltransferase
MPVEPSRPAGGRVHSFRRTAGQIDELKACCQLWRAGDERFWSFDDVLLALSRAGSLGYFAADREDGPWQGVILADVGPFSADLLYVYVKAEYRRAGVGQELLAALLAELTRRPQIEALFLEVRESNRSAQALYRKMGLTLVGRRKAYYANGEDAQVLRYELVRP